MHAQRPETGEPGFSWYARHPLRLLAVAGGLGLAPLGPGSVAAAAATCAYLLLPVQGDSVVFLACVATSTIVAVPAARSLMRGNRDDPKRMVWDEVVGAWVALLWLPKEWPYVLAAFLLFRLFDVAKPVPIRRLERLPGGIGIVADDILAGVYANVLVQLGMLATG